MSDEVMKEMFDTSHLSGGSAEYVDNLYEMYLDNPESVPPEWGNYFAALPVKHQADVSHAAIRNAFRRAALSHAKKAVTSLPASSTATKKQTHVLQLIQAYREHGHHQAKLDPLGLAERLAIPDLSLEYHQLNESDLSTVFSSESFLTKNGAPLSEIVNALNTTYCASIGVEFMHISDNRITSFFIERMETVRGQPAYSTAEKKRILQQLTAAEGLERYLGTRFVGQKRFSLEGGDAFIPLVDEIIQRAGRNTVKEIIIGMAHRGRLNLLVNVLGKSPEMLYEEFEGRVKTEMSGDVKYHMGYSSDIKTEEAALHLALAFNPSHLEIIAPVVEGSVRARLRRWQDLEKKEMVLPIIVHGDAAFAGQGVVMETFNFSQARGYSTGGTIHIVINNQVGFTTSNPLDARSTLYCTDVAKMVQAPVIHVNGDDPEAVVFAAQLAFDFRQAFKKDVVIDLVCYRRHGHNEADEPAITQPVMYEVIRKMPTPRERYAEKLIQQGVLSQGEVEKYVSDYRDRLDKGLPVVETFTQPPNGIAAVDWTPFIKTEWTDSVKTTLTLKKIQALGKIMVTLPPQFTPHMVVKRLLDDREKMTAGQVAINWGYAETLAYASLLDAGYPVRLSGQDSGRGTFAHRHAVLHDAKTGESFIPLSQINTERDFFLVIDSVLSEEAVLGFEYGYASAEPNSLALWEAQFGDFANGAQVIIDQFISSGEQKWGRLCGLVMLLPHGYEGQGPEHSSARLERYLQLCAQHNMQVCVPTTPAQIFHLLRRQMLRPFRKPLIIMSPKSLLRHKLAVSSLEDLTGGEFQLIINEIENIDPAKTRRVVLCSGKIYYELLEERRKNLQEDIAIFRIEQLYPFPKTELKHLLKTYSHVKDIVWCQEEPMNQGAWYPSRHNIEASLLTKQILRFVGRDSLAAAAEGSAYQHAKQQRQIVEEALK